ncbi:MAG: DNA replication/repair protein RecF [Myxococcota bacterium]
MRLTRLSVSHWRNLPAATVVADARFIILHGDNAQGKTNLLEAVYVLAALRSFREHRPQRLIQHGHKETRIDGLVHGTSGSRRLQWRYGPNGRKILLDGSPPSALRDWFAPIRAILFCPEHTSIVRGGPTERRRFIDRARFTAQPAYLDLVREYQRAIKQKGALLRAPRRASDAELDVWDEQIADLGVRMAQQRLMIIDELRGPFQEMVAEISGKDKVDLVMHGVGIPGVTPGSLRDRLQQARRDERRRKMILIGPHRDDVGIRLNGRPARQYASQGQARSIVLALKLAELVAAKRRNEAPLFLLDDLTSELDQRRRRKLVEILGGMESQVWITTTDPRYLGPLPDARTQPWRVAEGAVRSGIN